MARVVDVETTAYMLRTTTARVIRMSRAGELRPVARNPLLFRRADVMAHSRFRHPAGSRR